MSRPEGYLMVDHRASPGLTEQQAIKAGFHPSQVKEGALFEAAILYCKHCGTQVVKNPLRTRPRAYCPKCNDYICDWCEAARHDPNYVHRTIAEVAEQTLAANSKGVIQ